MAFKTSIKKTAEIEAASKGEEHLLANICHPGLHGTSFPECAWRCLNLGESDLSAATTLDLS